MIDKIMIRDLELGSRELLSALNHVVEIKGRIGWEMLVVYKCHIVTKSMNN